MVILRSDLSSRCFTTGKRCSVREQGSTTPKWRARLGAGAQCEVVHASVTTIVPTLEIEVITTADSDGLICNKRPGIFKCVNSTVSENEINDIYLGLIRTKAEHLRSKSVVQQAPETGVMYVCMHFENISEPYAFAETKVILCSSTVDYTLFWHDTSGLRFLSRVRRVVVFPIYGL